jgi:hypothetical protein
MTSVRKSTKLLCVKEKHMNYLQFFFFFFNFFNFSLCWRWFLVLIQRRAFSLVLLQKKVDKPLGALKPSNGMLLLMKKNCLLSSIINGVSKTNIGNKNATKASHVFPIYMSFTIFFITKCEKHSYTELIIYE